MRREEDEASGKEEEDGADEIGRAMRRQRRRAIRRAGDVRMGPVALSRFLESGKKGGDDDGGNEADDETDGAEAAAHEEEKQEKRPTTIITQGRGERREGRD